MTYSPDAHPVLVIAHRADTARDLRQRLDRAPLRATATTLRPDGGEPVVVEPDVTVVLALPAGNRRAWDVVSHLHRGSVRPLVVVVADEPSGPVADLCLLAGARTVLDASAPDDALTTAIDRVRRGAGPDPAIAGRRRRALERLVAGGSPRPRDQVRISRLEPVTRRGSAAGSDRRLLLRLGPAQRAIVEGVLRGATVPEIAAERSVSEAAAYAARRRLAARLHVSHDEVDAEIARRFEGLVRTDQIGDVPVDSTHARPRTTRSNVYAVTR